MLRKHKVYIVAKEYAQILSINLLETFSLITRINMIKTVLTLAAQKKKEDKFINLVLNQSFGMESYLKDLKLKG